MTTRGARIEILGHRGARGLRPENTLPGFAHALEIGVDAVELDVGLTADGVVVCNHDQALSPVNCRDTGPATPGDPLFPYVGRALRELTLAQIKTIDAGARHRADALAATLVPMPGTPPPTLAEAAALFADYADPRLAVELKTSPEWSDAEVEWFVATVREILESAGLRGRFRLLGFDWRVIVAARLMLPELECVALVEEATIEPGTRWLAGLDPGDIVAAALAAGAGVLSAHHRQVTGELVDDAHDRGLRVTPWTVNDPAEMARFVDLGVDGIVTDYPDRARIVLGSRGLPLPPPLPPPAKAGTEAEAEAGVTASRSGGSLDRAGRSTR
ncbi:MAG TPA: glycerophosphodiester phosphodiesterase family protein [Streptosporangiaceae bacterium]|nr:glycerophosphodiester phosphodiesterase family protein [Streptosporangiaceae bacterium]